MGGNMVDDRVEVDLDQSPLDLSTAIICRIISLSEGGECYGSGIVLDWNIDGQNVKFVMTCAHNFVDPYEKMKTGRTVQLANPTCYTMMKGINSFASCYKVIKSYIHPAYCGDPSTGFDYAIGILALSTTGDREEPSNAFDDYFIA